MLSRPPCRSEPAAQLHSQSCAQWHTFPVSLPAATRRGHGRTHLFLKVSRRSLKVRSKAPLPL
eukprot:8541991-Pyramimonas_sp.AAC.1